MQLNKLKNLSEKEKVYINNEEYEILKKDLDEFKDLSYILFKPTNIKTFYRLSIENTGLKFTKIIDQIIDKATKPEFNKNNKIDQIRKYQLIEIKSLQQNGTTLL